MAPAHQAEPWIGQKRGSGITDQGDGFTVFHGRDQAIFNTGVAVIMIGDELAMGDAHSGQHQPGVPCVLTGNEIGVLQAGLGAR